MYWNDVISGFLGLPLGILTFVWNYQAFDAFKANPNQEGAKKLLLANYKVFSMWLSITSVSIIYKKIK